MSVSIAEKQEHEIALRRVGSHCERLSDHADLLASWLARPERCPQRWRDGQFGRLVDLVRAHLRPIGARGLLAHSYAREHFHLSAVGQPPAASVLLTRDATEVAYALCWLELRHGRRFEAWPALVRSSAA